MTGADFRFEQYDWRGECEHILVQGDNNDRQVIIIPPLFEEGNLLRAFIVDVARLLSDRDIGTWLPDLPGTGESRRAIEDIGWQDWRDAARAAAEAVEGMVGRRPHVASFRGGALLADAVPGASWWAFAPAPGSALLRYLMRTQLISDRENGTQSTDLAGYRLSADLRAQLEAATVVQPAGPVRSLPADAFGVRAPLWHRAEPGRDPSLSAAIADDIASWIASCDGC